MDPSRFDGLARGIAGFTSRRTTLAGLLAGLAVPLLGEGASEARKQRKKHRQDHDHNQADKKQGHARHGVDAEKKKKKKKKCKPPTTKCGKLCINTASDRANCGACGKACAAVESCKGGVCTCDGAICAGCCASGTCQAGTSNQQCGAGGTVCKTCPTGTTCVNGVCACGAGGPCGAGQTCCAGTCVNTQTDANNCGGCGNTCPPGEACSGGKCGCGSSATCAGGDTCCNDACADTGTDYANCGTCGHTCRANETCDSGACTCGSNTCAQDELCCDGATCSPIETDFTHCGSCSNACDAQTADACQDGNCTCGGLAACGANQRCCGGQCVDTQTNFNNCNGCGFSCNTLKADTCSGGTCKCGQFAACGANEQCCGGQCVNTTTVQNCGACGNVCPGYQTANSNVTCQNGTTCFFSCQGDHFDVNNNPSDGCEGTYTFSNHTKPNAILIGNVDCFDSSGGTTPSRTFFSDARVHESPPITGIFDSATGSAPHWWMINATGGFGCQNDLNVKLTMTGATGNCYKLTVETTLNTYTALTVNGVAQIIQGPGSYNDGTSVYFKVEKTCGTNVREAPTYTIAYHL